MGGIIKDENGNYVGHISSPDGMTKEKIKWWEEQCGEKMLCKKCGKPVDEGGTKDHFWPYYNDNNRCTDCLEDD